MVNVGEYIEALIKEGGHRQSDIARAIGVPRQLLSYAIGGRRELSMSLALKLESYFNLHEGKLLKMQTQQSIQHYKQGLKKELAQQLIRVNAFWSYANISAESIPNEELIERVFIYLDMQDIAKLFELYSWDYLRRVWRSRLAVQGDYLFNLNVMIALYYFNIKQPEKYLRRIEREHVKYQLSHA